MSKDTYKITHIDSTPEDGVREVVYTGPLHLVTDISPPYGIFKILKIELMPKTTDYIEM